jgi:hypothetical protein
MASIRGSSQFKAIKGITIYGITGPTGPQGPRGTDFFGRTGPTASIILSGITLSAGFTLVTRFTNGTSFSASGLLYGVTGDTTIYLDGKTGSTGTGYVFVGATASERTIQLRKIKGSTGYRSYIGVTQDSDTITISVDRYDGEYGLSAGTLAQIIATDSNGKLIGVTLGAAKYLNLANTVQINKANVFERTIGAKSGYGTYLTYINIVGSDRKVFITLKNNNSDTSNSKIYSIDLNEFGRDTTEIILPSPQVTPLAITLHIQNGETPENYIRTTFRDNNGKLVVFPFNRHPCFRSGENYVLHFISVKDTWYGYIFNKVAGSGNYFCSNVVGNFTETANNILNFYSGITGSCCKGDGTCEITTDGLCDGFFAGVGTTCGVIGSTSVCSETVGSCCIKNTSDGQISTYCIENVSPFDCLMLNNFSVESVFTGTEKTCKDVNCQNCFDKTGGCCDGKGNCKDLTKEDCIASGGSFLGRGILCYSDDTNPTCSSGSGACCYTNGTCTVTDAYTCFSNDGNYHGNGTSCNGITCASQLSCGGYLGFPLSPGDLIGGGMVVGIYNPRTSRLLGGAHAFSRQGITASFMYGGETGAGYYTSENDYVGYGVTGESCLAAVSQDVDSYYIIVSLYPASVDVNGNSVNPTEELAYNDTFPWYGDGNAWGPILNLTTYTYGDFTYLTQSYDSSYMRYGEGYYGVTGESLDNIKNVTFQSCYSTRKNGIDPVARLFTRTVKSSNGLWNRNWGLYNTIRMLSADNADYLKISQPPYFTSDEFTSGVDMTAVRALKLFDNDDYTNNHGLTANPNQLTDWYIPSHDELAFIAANTVTDSTNPYYGFNTNSYLLSNGGVPLYDWHWSSTGSFDITSPTEGVYISGKPEHGSVAWALYFDSSGDSTNFKVKKETRSSELKVRPIRALRCDGVVPDVSSEQYKLWKTPDLLRNKQ